MPPLSSVDSIVGSVLTGDVMPIQSEGACAELAHNYFLFLKRTGLFQLGTIYSTATTLIHIERNNRIQF